MTEEGQRKAVSTCKFLGLDSIIAIGGDGTFRGARALSKYGINVIGIPGTIDNDISCTNYCIGFDTAANTAIECIDKLRDTMQSHERCSVVEVMGRNAGYLAMYVGLAVGATAVLVPEEEIDFERDVIEKIRQARFNGFTHYMIVVAEGVGSASDIAKKIKDAIDLDPRVTVLGHIQRGGVPSGRDRVNATKMGFLAAELLLEGKTNRIVCTKNGSFTDIDIEEGLSMKKTLNKQQLDALNAMTGL
jgi:6-phosphofructokinase 1